MLILPAFAFLAGIVTVLSPCILPVLPLVLSGSVGSGKSRPWGIITGFILSFTIFTLTLSALTRALGVPADAMRFVAAGIVLLFGLVMVIPALKEKFAAFTSKLASSVSAAPNMTGEKKGFWGGLILGFSLGLVWTPCVGPIMASVISLALSGGSNAASFVITAAYAAGTAIPLMLIMKGGRALLVKFSFLSGNAGRIQRIFGVLMIGTAIALVSGLDRRFQSLVLDLFPSYGAGLTSIENNAFVLDALEKRAVKSDPATELDPLTLGSGVWINSIPLTLQGLRGKVVLVDFWTYSCINCIRTVPYLRAWHEKYAASGLVIVGIHSPEFAFERSEQNVRKAVRELGVTWPVAMDNDFGVWNAYSNRYWPAQYLYSKDGMLESTHFGEGAYDETEALIQKLLGIEVDQVSAFIKDSVPVAVVRSPETYLGYSRGERFSSREDPDKDALAEYSMPAGKLEKNRWAFEGSWNIGSESSAGTAGSALSFSFEAAKVYLVINPLPGSVPEAFVTVDGVPVDGGDVREGILKLDSDRLYTLYDKIKPGKGVIKIRLKGQAEVYALTFG